jgi:hypothetical protein
LNLSHYSNEHRILNVLRARNTTPLCHLSDTNNFNLKYIILIYIITLFKFIYYNNYKVNNDFLYNNKTLKLK